MYAFDFENVRRTRSRIDSAIKAGEPIVSHVYKGKRKLECPDSRFKITLTALSEVPVDGTNISAKKQSLSPVLMAGIASPSESISRILWQKDHAGHICLS